MRSRRPLPAIRSTRPGVPAPGLAAGPPVAPCAIGVLTLAASDSARRTRAGDVGPLVDTLIDLSVQLVAEVLIFRTDQAMVDAFDWLGSGLSAECGKVTNVLAAPHGRIAATGAWKRPVTSQAGHETVAWVLWAGELAEIGPTWLWLTCHRFAQPPSMPVAKVGACMGANGI